MTTKTFYKFSLTLPVLLPLLLMAACPQAGPTSFFSAPLEYGGIPYAFLAFCLFVWMQDKTTDQVSIGILCSPLLMPIALLLYEVIQYLFLRWTDGGQAADFGGEWIFLSFFAVPLGYVYIGIVCSVLWIMKGLHLVRDQD